MVKIKREQCVLHLPVPLRILLCRRTFLQLQLISLHNNNNKLPLGDVVMLCLPTHRTFLHHFRALQVSCPRFERLLRMHSFRAPSHHLFNIQVNQRSRLLLLRRLLIFQTLNPIHQYHVITQLLDMLCKHQKSFSLLNMLHFAFIWVVLSSQFGMKQCFKWTRKKLKSNWKKMSVVVVVVRHRRARVVIHLLKKNSQYVQCQQVLIYCFPSRVSI
mmetsp:Transcript_17945/g.26714  ORF Transcript_17945/g.26714 Transcript_17945/m.26714 type:complete len:215 (-) Transcript_17945:1020-1664(-)